MSKPRITFKKCYFKAEDGGAVRDQLPAAYTDAEYLGTVLSLSGARESEEAIFETPMNGKWVDYDAINQRDREIITVTCNELSPLFAELVECTTGPYATSGNQKSYTPGKTVTRIGWFAYIVTDDKGANINACSRWAKIDVPSWEYPQTGYMQASFTVRVLYSPVATGRFDIAV